MATFPANDLWEEPTNWSNNNPLWVDGSNENGVSGLINGDGIVSEEAVVIDDDDNDFLTWSTQIKSDYNPLVTDFVQITEIPEKEGILVFKHTNYLIESIVQIPNLSKQSKVIRRYSDFNWLWEVLLKKYPFRTIPELPPKQLINKQDLNLKRLKGLIRFLNQILKHPILSKDPLVLIFLSISTDLSNWRKSTNFDESEEFTDLKIDQNFIKIFNSNNSFINEFIFKIESNIDKFIHNWKNLTILVERFEKKLSQLQFDNQLFIENLSNLSISKIYTDLNDDLTTIDNNISSITKHLSSNNELVQSQSQSINSPILEDFKKFNDLLNSIKSLFNRYQHHKQTNQLESIQKSLQLNKDRLSSLNGKPDVKGFEIDKLNELINLESLKIDQLTNKNWLIEKTLLIELIYFQKTKLLIMNVLKKWGLNNLKYNELFSNNWNKLIESLEDPIQI